MDVMAPPVQMLAGGFGMPPTRPSHAIHIFCRICPTYLSEQYCSQPNKKSPVRRVRLLPPPWRKKAASGFGPVVFYDTSFCLGLLACLLAVLVNPHGPTTFWFSISHILWKSTVSVFKETGQDMTYEQFLEETPAWKIDSDIKVQYPYPVSFISPCTPSISASRVV